MASVVVVVLVAVFCFIFSYLIWLTFSFIDMSEKAGKDYSGLIGVLFIIGIVFGLGGFLLWKEGYSVGYDKGVAHTEAKTISPEVILNKQ